MKSNTIVAGGFVLMSVLTLATGCSKTDSADSGGKTLSPSSLSSGSGPKIYELKSGIVYFEPMTMPMMKSTQTLYFDDYGRKEARETVTEMEFMGKKQFTHEVEIWDDGYSISYQIKKDVNGKDETKKEAKKTDMRAMAEMRSMMGSPEIKQQFDYREEGTEEIAGVTGTKYSVTMSKDNPENRITGVVYKNIVIESQMGGIKVRAARIEENANIPASKFQIPSDYTITEVSSPL